MSKSRDLFSRLMGNFRGFDFGLQKRISAQFIGCAVVVRSERFVRMMRKILKSAFFIPLILGLGNTPVHSEPKQTDLCEVREFVQSLYADPPSPPKPLNGPIKGCIKGDAIHFHIDAAKVPYAEIVSRFCDLTKTVVVEQFKNYTHVVCSYDWKWAKQVTRTVHPDSK